MGRSASHVTLECALKCRPNLVFIGEEIRANKWTLSDITTQLVDMIEARMKQGTPFGLVLLPEGMIEFIDEIGVLIKEINEVLGSNQNGDDITKHLTNASKTTWMSLPTEIQNQLQLDRDSHGNVTVSQIETEKLLVQCALSEMRRRNNVDISKFKYQNHFFGYEGRSALPSNFDSTYVVFLNFYVYESSHSLSCLITGIMSLIHITGTLSHSNTNTQTQTQVLLRVGLHSGSPAQTSRYWFDCSSIESVIPLFGMDMFRSAVNSSHECGKKSWKG